MKRNTSLPTHKPLWKRPVHRKSLDDIDRDVTLLKDRLHQYRSHPEVVSVLTLTYTTHMNEYTRRGIPFKESEGLMWLHMYKTGGNNGI